MVEKNSTDLVLTRLFDAPVAMVWQAWTDPKKLMQWWGPESFTSPICKVDFRVGGKMLLCMRDPGGKDYWSTGEIREIVPMKRLVYTDSFSDAEGNIVSAAAYGMGDDFPDELLVTVEFENLGSKTRMTLTTAGLPAGEMLQMTGLGWSGSFDKLENSLLIQNETGPHKLYVTIEPGKQEISYKRIFDAPRDLVFKVYTDPSLIPHFWGPQIYTTVVEKMEVKPGGQWRYIQKDDQGGEYGFHGVYHSIEAPLRIVNTFEYEGVPGHVSLESLRFDEIDGKTVLNGLSVFQSVADRDGMAQTGMESGMTELMDRLEALLVKEQA
ncbi:MAG: SRPBCC domain-containing protein [Bellilinea sp.]